MAGASIETTLELWAYSLRDVKGRIRPLFGQERVAGSAGQFLDALCMKNMENADRPKSAMAILPPRPFRGSGKAAQMAFKPARRDGKSFIPMVNHFFSDSGILKIRYF